jgi:hypothetical protein
MYTAEEDVIRNSQTPTQLEGIQARLGKGVRNVRNA